MTSSPASRVGQADVLDALAVPLAGVATPLVREPLRRWLGGEWLGHPLHPLLTDLPIGFFTSAFMLDLVGGRSGRKAAQRLIGVGLLTVPMASVTGASDWRASENREVRRVGVVHAVLNVAGTLAFWRSWSARRAGHHGSGVGWQLVGSTLLTAAGYLGGHLAFSAGEAASPSES